MQIYDLLDPSPQKRELNLQLLWAFHWIQLPSLGFESLQFVLVIRIRGLLLVAEFLITISGVNATVIQRSTADNDNKTDG